MALSNIFCEPRREITESVVGIAVFIAFLVPDYYLARWFQSMDTAPLTPLGFFMVLAAFALGVIFIALPVFLHWIGEETCDYLRNRGLELRPKERY